MSETQVFYFHPDEQHYVFAGTFPFKHPLILAEEFIHDPHITIRLRPLTREPPPFRSEEKKGEDKKGEDKKG